MKATGIVRRIDTLGRIVLPIELRRSLNIDVKDPFEMYVDGDMIVFKKYEPSCIFCGNCNELKMFEGKKVCIDCIAKLSK